MSQLENDASYQTKTQLDSAISSAISKAIASVMTYKGSKNTVVELPKSSNKIGDVWHVAEDGNEYAWDGTQWEALGSLMNVSVDWNDITGKPSKFTPETHTHAVGDVNGLQDALDGKANSSHTHNYAGSASPGGSANSAVKLDTSAGTATQPVYFSGGKPVATTHSLAASVPANAKFTDTTYSDMVGATASTAGKHGLVPAPAVGAATRYLRSDGTWQVPPDTNTTYSDATQSKSGLMSATDKTKLDGMEQMVAITTTEIDDIFN